MKTKQQQKTQSHLNTFGEINFLQYSFFDHSFVWWAIQTLCSSIF